MRVFALSTCVLSPKAYAPALKALMFSAVAYVSAPNTNVPAQET